MRKLFRFPSDYTHGICPCLCFVDIISANKAIERFDESEAEEVAVLLDIRLLQTFRGWEEFGRLAQ